MGRLRRVEVIPICLKGRRFSRAVIRMSSHDGSPLGKEQSLRSVFGSAKPCGDGQAQGEGAPCKVRSLMRATRVALYDPRYIFATGGRDSHTARAGAIACDHGLLRMTAD